MPTGTGGSSKRNRNGRTGDERDDSAATFVSISLIAPLVYVAEMSADRSFGSMVALANLY